MKRVHGKRRMNKFTFYAIAIAISGPVFFPSCVGEPAKPVFNLPLPSEPAKTVRAYSIMDFKNKAKGEAIPEWVSLYLAQGNHGVETESVFRNRFVFVYSNEGNNFRALELLSENFSTRQDFPRLAAARIEARFSTGVPYPDIEYGAFFEALIRTASDAVWTGAARTDDFWLLKKYQSGGEPSTREQGEVSTVEDETENWELLILVTIEKSRFNSQLESIFQKITPDPQPSEEQIAAANGVKENFFEGF